MTKPTIGFIGVGLMGHGMGLNILKGGYPLVVVAHRNRGPVEDLLANGATEAASIAELAAQCDIIHICVSGSPQVEAVIGGEGGIAANARAGTIIVDCSTSDPVSTEQLASMLAERGLALADAPLGGTPANAQAGTLGAMVGADDETFARIEPVLQSWAKNIVHLGPVGLGHKMKLINNFMSLGNAALLSEALVLARKSGLSVEQFHKVIGSSRMHNGFYDTFMKWTMERDENAHRFTITNAHKDMRYLSNLAVSVSAVNPVQSVIRNHLSAMEAAGKGELFVPMLADFIAAMNGLDRED
ncbi:NAD(P)-dependent oxidoreductase [Aliiruegeria sabulilitoris]|uniref:NAD(P)-dependent oxidoreductase n=1 Tax=Aliiruegeria sabulilitoris TaxID=1510458 RepID=UPI0008294F2B|nr:NAD(P)-dependent oxidoreductase [Aliiruegeria sabulilitoris]NDR59687.1 NAD(P)-dependent oxidoreductase [Pseudoruegeria sp. M32A2M]